MKKFKQGTRRKPIEYEKDLIRYWKKHKTFEKSVEIRAKNNAYVFYDGPPFITGVPHLGTLLSSIVKDVVPRYWTMKGKRVERVWGWDTHGLPAENFVEKKLGITDRQDIGTKISMAQYITTARESMIQTGNLWEDVIDRVGRWVNFKGAYKTMDKDYMESVWWAFKVLYENGKIYEGERVLLYDTQWATPLSKAEVTMDAGAYQVVTDPSVYVKFKLTPESAKELTNKLGIDQAYGRANILAWTTTPWTLPGNTALAVGKDLVYRIIRLEDDLYIVADELVDKVFVDEKHQPLEIKTERTLQGKDLLGLSYQPIFEDRGGNAHKIWSADYVTTESGTGIVHLAPAYGEEDFEMAKENNIPAVHVLDEHGTYIEGDWKGHNVWEINKTIAKTLLERGVVWKIDYIQHEYPHNLRNGNRLMYRAHPSWFMDIDGQRTEMLEENTKNISWFPEHIKHGRFENTINTAPDWNLSRDRFWATAMPVWKATDKKGNEHVKVIGSYAELKELSGVELEDYHRPWIDDVTFELEGLTYKRIDKVLDCWFESGSMPFAQFHYPFENKNKFEANFPGDFIVEYVGQVRAWFYYVHAVNVGLFGKNAFKNVIVTGNLMGNDGHKLSKSRGNYTDPNELMDQYSADSVRFLILSSPVLNGEDFAVRDKEVADVARKLSMVWNMYDFFTMYAEVDKWEWNGKLEDPSGTLNNPLDQWIVSRMHQLVNEVDFHMQSYDLPNAVKPILPFIDDASNWYVRRSRRRFWKSGDDDDKNAAYRTLHYVLVQLAHVMAPFTPFLSEELYRKLTGGESVHLNDWPEAGHVNELLIQRMAAVRHLINIGLAIRSENAMKVRQPLAKATLRGNYKEFPDELLDILKEELNIKQVVIENQEPKPDKTSPENTEEANFKQLYQIELDLKITPELRREGMAREAIRHIQSARKKSGLSVDDRIDLELTADNDELIKAVKKYQKVISHETLAVHLTINTSNDQDLSDADCVEVNGANLIINLKIAQNR